jgi:hypothetical protein
MNRLLREYVADQWRYSYSLTSMILAVGYYTSQYLVCHEISSLCVLLTYLDSSVSVGFSTIGAAMIQYPLVRSILWFHE